MFKRAFTIVELLIVIVVIGVLAAIIIVSYFGITQSANVSTVQANISQVATKLEQYKIANSDSYPVDESTAESYTGIQLSNYFYNQNSVTGVKNYCATYTASNVSYSVSSTSPQPIQGVCVENMVIDPDAAGNPSHFSRSGSAPDTYSTTVISTLQSHHGSTSLRKVVATVNTAGGGAGATAISSGVVTAGTRFNYSGWVYVTRADVIHPYADTNKVSDGSYGCSNTSSWSATTSIPANTWTYFNGYVIPGVDCTNIAGGGYQLNSLQVGDEVYFDQFMLTRGNNFYNYGDGNSTGWFWEGAPNNSASIGPSMPQ